MENDYYHNNKKNRSFDSEQEQPRKRQRLQESPKESSPQSAGTSSESAKDRSALTSNDNEASPSQTYPHYSPENSHGGPAALQSAYYHHQYPDSYKHPQFAQYGDMHTATHPNALNSSPAEAEDEMHNNNSRQQLYSYDNQGQYVPPHWDPYNYHYQQQLFHSHYYHHQYHPWAQHFSRYPPDLNNSSEPSNSPPSFQYSTKDEGEFYPAAPYPYYAFPNYPYPQHHPYEPSAPPHRPDYYPHTSSPPSDPTTTEEMPAPQRILSLFMACDEERLSEYQCVARKSIQVFSATNFDIQMTVQGRNRQVLPGQVGIRCRFCAHIPIKKQARASVYYPSKLDCIYQAAQNLTSVHLAKYCAHVPDEIRNELLRHMKDRKSSAGGGKEYWAVSARSMGIEEFDGRLHFRREMHTSSNEPEVASPNNNSGG